MNVTFDIYIPELEPYQWTMLGVGIWYFLAYIVIRLTPIRVFDLDGNLTRPSDRDASPNFYRVVAWLLSPLLGLFLFGMSATWIFVRLFFPFTPPSQSTDKKE